VLESPSKRFPLGATVATANALLKLSAEDILRGLERHQAGDWGDVCENDRKVNESALQNGERLLSVYHTNEKIKYWVITEADRSGTTVLLPEDY
jgi:hypothetical protein